VTLDALAAGQLAFIVAVMLAAAFVRRWRVPAGLAAGLLGGVFEATANVAVPPLIIYLMLLGLPPVAMVQTLNLCFTVGKSVQVGTWALHGNAAAAL
jgi:hypothetical protein